MEDNRKQILANLRSKITNTYMQSKENQMSRISSISAGIGQRHESQTMDTADLKSNLNTLKDSVSLLFRKIEEALSLADIV